MRLLPKWLLVITATVMVAESAAVAAAVAVVAHDDSYTFRPSARDEPFTGNFAGSVPYKQQETPHWHLQHAEQQKKLLQLTPTDHHQNEPFGKQKLLQYPHWRQIQYESLQHQQQRPLPRYLQQQRGHQDARLLGFHIVSQQGREHKQELQHRHQTQGQMVEFSGDVTISNRADVRIARRILRATALSLTAFLGAFGVWAFATLAKLRFGAIDDRLDVMESTLGAANVAVGDRLNTRINTGDIKFQNKINDFALETIGQLDRVEELIRNRLPVPTALVAERLKGGDGPLPVYNPEYQLDEWRKNRFGGEEEEENPVRVKADRESINPNFFAYDHEEVDEVDVLDEEYEDVTAKLRLWLDERNKQNGNVPVIDPEKLNFLSQDLDAQAINDLYEIFGKYEPKSAAAKEEAADDVNESFVTLNFFSQDLDEAAINELYAIYGDEALAKDDNDDDDITKDPELAQNLKNLQDWRKAWSRDT